MKKLGIIFIGTGRYIGFYPEWRAAIDRHFCNDVEKQIFVFTDAQSTPVSDEVLVPIPHLPWPKVTLSRYRSMLKIYQSSQGCSHFVYMDADMVPVADICFDELFSGKDIFCVNHPGYPECGQGDYDTNPSSNAFVGIIPPGYLYSQGCLWGAEWHEFFTLVIQCVQWTDADQAKGHTPPWHDESYLNKYLIGRMGDFNQIPSSYCYPEGCGYTISEKKILHQYKPSSEFARFRGAHP
jgi:hypothetical protein